jgi:hypothetical protein
MPLLQILSKYVINKALKRKVTEEKKAPGQVEGIMPGSFVGFSGKSIHLFWSFTFNDSDFRPDS